MAYAYIDDYPHRMGGHCGSGALRDLLEWAGLGWDGPPGEGLVLGLGGGLSFSYIRFPDARPPVYFVGRSGSMELDLCRRLGIETRRLHADDADEGWRRITREVDAGRPVMIWADIAELPYLRVRLSNTRHSIVVIGYDTDRGVAWVVDNDREAVQEIPVEALMRAHGSDGFLGPNRHATYPMRFPKSLPELLPAARDAAASAAASLRSGELLFDRATRRAAQVIVSGLDGVRVFADDLARWPRLLDADSLEAALQAIPVFVEKAGTGGGFFRRLEAEFCADVARLTGDRAFAAAADALHACAEAWSTLAARTASGEIAVVSAAAAELPGVETRAVEALETAGGSAP